MRISESSNIRTLYIDRDPGTFKEIARHLQGEAHSNDSYQDRKLMRAGYHVRPRDGEQFVKLFADSQFYTCSPLSLSLSRARARARQSPY